MAYIEKVSDADAAGVLRKVYDAALSRVGYVAQIIRVMSQDGASADASMRLYVSLMQRENALRASQREMLATVTSSVNGCYY